MTSLLISDSVRNIGRGIISKIYLDFRQKLDDVVQRAVIISRNQVEGTEDPIGQCGCVSLFSFLLRNSEEFLHVIVRNPIIFANFSIYIATIYKSNGDFGYNSNTKFINYSKLIFIVRFSRTRAKFININPFVKHLAGHVTLAVNRCMRIANQWAIRIQCALLSSFSCIDRAHTHN